MLSAEQFAEILCMLPTAQDGDHPTVRRAPRVEHACRVTITLGDNRQTGESFAVDVRDLSARGMAFQCDRDLPVGATFVTTLRAPDGKCVRILSTVVHRRDIQASQSLVGAEFTCVLDQAPEFHTDPTPEDLMVIRSSILD